MKNPMLSLPALIILYFLLYTGSAGASGGNASNLILRAGLLFNDPIVSLHPNRVNGLDHDTDYTPSAESFFTFELIYRGLGLSLSNKLADVEEAERIYGRTESRDFSLFFYGEVFSIDIYYFWRKGVYILEDYEGTVENPYPQRPDIEITAAGLRFSYLLTGFGTGFSMDRAFKRTEAIRNFQAGLIMTLSPFYFDIDGDANLIPPDKAHLYPGISSLDGGEFYALGFLPGLAINVPVTVFYLMGSLSVGPALAAYRLSINGDDEWRRRWSYDALITVSMGLDVNVFFAGSSFTAEWSKFEGDQITIDYSNLFFEVFAGIRI